MTNNSVAAVDIALILPEDILQRCIETNSRHSDPSKYVRFDEAIFIPHVTLFQCFVNLSDKDQIIADLQDVSFFLSKNPVGLEIDRISWKEETKTFFYEFKPGGQGYQALKTLQYRVNFVMTKYMLNLQYRPNSSTFADGAPSTFDLQYVTEFQVKHTKEYYWPHITLGNSAEDMNQPVSIAPFLTSQLGLFRLCSGGTCSINYRWL